MSLKCPWIQGFGLGFNQDVFSPANHNCSQLVSLHCGSGWGGSSTICVWIARMINIQVISESSYAICLFWREGLYCITQLFLRLYEVLRKIQLERHHIWYPCTTCFGKGKYPSHDFENHSKHTTFQEMTVNGLIVNVKISPDVIIKSTCKCLVMNSRINWTW